MKRKTTTFPNKIVTFSEPQFNALCEALFDNLDDELAEMTIGSSSFAHNLKGALAALRAQKTPEAKATSGYWEDRLSAEQCAAINGAMETFKGIKRPQKRHEDDLYDKLTSAGLYTEEASDMINLLIDNN